jgi:hypothetical protein
VAEYLCRRIEFVFDLVTAEGKTAARDVAKRCGQVVGDSTVCHVFDGDVPCGYGSVALFNTLCEVREGIVEFAHCRALLESVG